jgi:hypothetical protein
MTSLRLPAVLAAVLLAVSACSSPAPSDDAGPGAPTSVAWHQQNLTFDHPGSWSWMPMEPAGHTAKFDVLGVLATVPLDGSGVCTKAGKKKQKCDFSSYALEPGSLAVTVLAGASLSADVWQDEAPADAEPSTAGGMPALFREQLTDDGNLQLQWRVARPDAAGGWFQLSAEIHPPGEAAARQELADLIASIAFDPAPAPEPLLDDNQTLSEVAASALQQLRASKHGASYACFPDQPGSRPGVVERLPGKKPLASALAVSCSIRAETTRWNHYRVRLRYAWPALGDQTAGSYVVTAWVTTDGRLDASLAEGDSP